MADILIDVEVKGNQKVVTAVNSTKSLESNVKALSDAMTKGSLSQRQYYKGISQLAESSGKSEKQLRDYATAIRRVEKESKAAKAAQDQERESIKAYTQARREATAANQRYDAELKKKARAEEEAARAAAKHASEMEQIKNKYVPLYAASKQYERAIEELNQAYVQGALTQGQYLAAMDSIDAQLANNTTRAKGNTRSMNAVGMAVQQTGYQVGDFLVQVQSGTNAFVAFGQQATQLVGILPMMAEQFGMNATRLALISTGLGIAIPLVTAFGAYWMRTSQQQEEAAKATSNLEDGLKSLDTTVKNWLRTKEAASAGITIEELLGLEGAEDARKRLEAERGKAVAAIQAQVPGIDLSKYSKEMAAILATSSDYTDVLADIISAENRLAAIREKQGQQQFKNFSEQRREMEQQLELSQAILVYGKESAYVKNLELQQEIENRKRAIDQQVKAKEITEAQGFALKKLVEDMLRAGDAADEFKGTIDSTSISSLAAQAGLLAANMGVAASEAVKYNAALNRQAGIPDNTGKPRLSFGIPGQDPSVSTGTGFSRLGFGNLDEPRTRNLIELPKPSSGSSGGSSGGAAKEQEDYVGKLLAEAEQKRKLIGLSEEETRRQEILYQLKEKGLPTDDKRIEQIIQMEAETRKLMEAEQQREQLMQTVTSNIESAFMTVVDGSKSVEDAFRGMLRNIILAVYQQQVAQPAATAIGNLAGKIFNFDGGGFTGYGSRSGGLDGKGGMMAMVHPNETVIDHTKGQSMGSVQVVNNFNIAANGDESVKRIIRGEVPRITEATKVAVLDAKRRGGSYGRAF